MTQTPTDSGEYSSILIYYGGLIVLFALLKGVFMFFMRQTIIVMSRKIEFDLKNEIYKHYQNLSIAFYKQNNTGDMMNRITEDVSRVRMYLGPALMYAINIVTLFCLVIITMFRISPTLSVYVLLPLPLLAISVYYVSNIMNERSEKVQQQLSVLTTFSQETFSGINILKSFRNEANSAHKFDMLCKEYTGKNLKLVKIDALFFPLIIFMIGLSTILTVYFGGKQATWDPNFTTGNIAEFIIYVNMLSWPVASVGWITSLIQRSAASQERINEFLNTKSEIVNYTDTQTPILTGMWGARQIRHSASTKSFTVTESNYHRSLYKERFSHANETPVYNSDGVPEPNIKGEPKRISDWPAGRLEFGSAASRNVTNINKSNGKPTFPWHTMAPSVALQRLMQTEHCLNYQLLKVRLHGISGLEAGQTLMIKLPDIGEGSGYLGGPAVWTNRYNNVWVIKSLSHNIIAAANKPAYYCDLTLANLMNATEQVLPSYDGTGSANF